MKQVFPYRAVRVAKDMWQATLSISVASLISGLGAVTAGAQVPPEALEYRRVATQVFASLQASSLLDLSFAAQKAGQLRVIPASAPANTPRMVFLRTPELSPWCGGDYYWGAYLLDLSTLTGGILNIGALGPIRQNCPSSNGGPYFGPTHTFAYQLTPTLAGTTRVSYADPLGTALETTMVTTPVGTATPRYDINGMWYDPASNGSGISMHQAANSGSATLGTWFMFDKQGTTRWYSLQGSSWIATDTLEGVFIEASASCAAGGACPVKADVLTPTYNFKMKFQSATAATAEVFGEGGALLFKSELRRLQL